MEATENGPVLSVDSEPELPVDVKQVENGNDNIDVEENQIVDGTVDPIVCADHEKDDKIASESEMAVEQEIAIVTNDAATQITKVDDRNGEIEVENDIAIVANDVATQIANDDVKNDNEEFLLKLSELESECSELRSKNETLQRNYDDALSEICIAGCVKESLVELERQNASRIDEVATLQHLLSESTEENRSIRTRYEHEFARLQAIVDQLEHENKDLRIQLKVSEKGLNSLEGVSSGLPGVDRDSLLAISDVTKSFARKVKSNFQQSVMNPQGNSPAHQPTSPVHVSHLVEEESMKRAYEDTELLKSIVVPLEEQIQALKDKLRQTDTLLREHESRQSKVVLAAESLGGWLNGLTTEEAVSKLEAKDDDTNSDLYVALLVTRLSLLTAELEARRREHSSLVSELEKSRKFGTEFKKRLTTSTSELLHSEQRHLAELSRVTSLLTDEQKNELAQIAEKDLLADQGSPVPVVKHEGEEIVVLAEAWNDLQKELSRLRTLLGVGLNDGVVGSDSYRRLKARLDEMEMERDRLAETESKLRAEIQRESEARKEIESIWNEKAEVHKTETEAFSDRIRELEGIVQNISLKYNVFVKEARKELEPLVSNREKIVAELKRLQRENDKLVGLHDVKSSEMQNEKIDLPDKLDDMQLLLLTYREELIHAKVAKEHYEEQLKSEVNFLKSQLLGEQQSKEGIEDQLTAEIEALREKVYLLESCRTELAAEQKRHKEFADHELRQRQAYAQLQRQVESLESDKRQLDTRIHEFKARVSNLQQELDNSVAVQNDFVRLSQSLQMELEKIRSQATEVRWQHEDDVDECNSCKHGFQSSRHRRKSHCRHCGKIFCPDCLSKSVPSGPQRRPARVCDVCHTLLVQHSAPYFSTDAPHIND